MTGNNETNGTDGEDMVASICADHGNQPAALIEILHHIQRDHGYIAEEAISTIAQAVNLSRAEVHGVVSFYHDFRREPPGRGGGEPPCSRGGSSWSVGLRIVDATCALRV